MKKRLFSPLLAAALAAAVALTATALPAFADGGEETPITIGQSQEQQAECTCTALCTGDNINGECPVCEAEDADLNKCKGFEAQPATLSNALPATALAAENAPATLIVGGTDVKSGGYWTTGTDGKLTSGSESSWNVHYDASSNTLILNDAKITGASSENTNYNTVGIYAGSSGDVSLEIKLQGENTITSGGYGIWVYSPDQGGAATLNITGENDGSLNASGSGNSGIQVQSNSGNATLSIKNAKVTATSSYNAGVVIQSSDGLDVSLTVDGGNLTATGSGVSRGGIEFQFGTGESGSGTPSLNVSNSAIVKASGDTGGITSNSSPVTPSGTGIVFNNGTGTVYGSVTLQENLTIGEGESLTIPDGASLNTNGKLTVDGGTLTDNVTGDVIYKVTGVSLNKNTTTIKVGGTETLTATVEPANATNEAVTWSSDNISVATVDANGLVTAVAEGSATITVTTEDGSKTATCTVIVTNNGSSPVLPPQPSDPAPSQPTGDGSSGGTGGTSSAAPRQQSSVVHNVSNSSAYRKGEYEFWMKVRTKIVSANPGEVIEVNAHDNDKMPNSVMQALAAKEDVTLRIRWNGGEEIVIPSAAALQEKMRMFYPLSYLAKFDFAQTPAKKVK